MTIPVQVHRPNRTARSISFLSRLLDVHLRVVGEDLNMTEMTFSDKSAGVNREVRIDIDPSVG